MKILLAVFGAAQVVLGLLLWITPGLFFDEIGPYGVRNDHYMGDLATWYLALGAVALLSLRRVSWRVPVLALAFIQYALHSVNHLIDVGEAHPEWLGPANLVSLTLTAVLLAWMLNVEREQVR
jgi:peptidoglycan/LPS O-acetylase OafA/YrhL